MLRYFEISKFNDELYRLIRSSGLKHSEIYRRGGLVKTTFSDVIKGKSLPHRETVFRLIIGLHCTPEEADYLLSLCGMAFMDGQFDQIIRNSLLQDNSDCTSVNLELMKAVGYCLDDLDISFRQKKKAG